MRRSTKLAAAASLIAIGFAACAEEEAAAVESEAETVVDDPFGDVVEVVTEEEAAVEAERTITEDNADEEFEKLKRELEEGS
ncbi:MAG: hypothetical protein O7B99_03500 [Planctomycetota bacterium]|nr:hypothetical protein [Planctomycetota bacterium]